MKTLIGAFHTLRECEKFVNELAHKGIEVIQVLPVWYDSRQVKYIQQIVVQSL